MLFGAYPNRKMSQSFMDEIFGIEDEDEVKEELTPHSSYLEVIKELEKLSIDVKQCTIVEILHILDVKLREVYVKCKSADSNYPYRRYEITPQNQKLHLIRTHIREAAIWMYDGQRHDMPVELRKKVFL
jgi:hypothetical protein